MGDVDPTGYQTALETIKPGQLSERQQRIAAGLALVRDGVKGYKAAQQVGVPWSTLWRYINNLSKVGNDDADGMEVDARALNEASMDVALIAAEAVRDELVNNRDNWKPADLIRAYSAATDRVLAFQGRTKSPDSGMTALQMLLQGRKVTIEDGQTGDQAVDVEGERIG